jgi:hypothetical protein
MSMLEDDWRVLRDRALGVEPSLAGAGEGPAEASTQAVDGRHRDRAAPSAPAAHPGARLPR